MSWEPARYHAWYESPRGAWMGARERRLLLDLLAPAPTTSVLDVGCGTGYFSSVLADAGLRVTGLDPDAAALNFALRRDPRITGVRGDAEALPFADATFNAAVAMTSLCFCARPEQALSELWRVSRAAVVLGLLHRRSLLYWQKAGRGSYQGARWDQLSEVRAWARSLDPQPVQIEARSALLLPSAGPLARWAERLSGIGRHSERLPLGGFLAVCLRRPAAEWHSRPAGAGQARAPVNFTGDGLLSMNVKEWVTAVQEGVHVARRPGEPELVDQLEAVVGLEICNEK